MVVGVPGSGIGGLYYIVLGLTMPALELIQTVRGRSSRQRWRVVGIQAGYAAGILAALAGGGWLLQFGCGWIIGVVSESPELAEARRQAIMLHLGPVAWTLIAWLSVLTLSAVVILPAILAWVLALRERAQARKSTVVGRSDSSR